jgi:hypothetical protein
VLFGLRQSTLSELDEACPSRTDCPKSKESRYDDLKFYHYGAQITLGVGVAAIGTAGALLFFQRKKKDPAADSANASARLQVLPTLPLRESDPIGASVRGSF